MDLTFTRITRKNDLRISPFRSGKILSISAKIGQILQGFNVFT